MLRKVAEGESVDWGRVKGFLKYGKGRGENPDVLKCLIEDGG